METSFIRSSSSEPAGTVGGAMPMTQQLNSSTKAKKSIRWLPIKDNDVMFLKTIFQEIDIVSDVAVFVVCGRCGAYPGMSTFLCRFQHLKCCVNVTQDKNKSIELSEVVHYFESSVVPHFPTNLTTLGPPPPARNDRGPNSWSGPDQMTAPPQDKVMSYLSNNVHGFFDTIDIDGSGNITFEEFVAAVLPQCPASQVTSFVVHLV